MRNDLVKNIIHQLKCGVYSANFNDSLVELLKREQAENNIFGVFHPLGFVIITLQDWSGGERLRLHIWPPDERKYNDGHTWIHNHGYSVISKVLIGKLTNYEYVISDFTSGCPVYDVSYVGNNSDLKITEKTCQVKLFSTVELANGSSYRLEKWKYHKVFVPENDITCTLILNFDKDFDSGNVLGTDEGNKDFLPFERINYNPLKLGLLLNCLYDQLT